MSLYRPAHRALSAPGQIKPHTCVVATPFEGPTWGARGSRCPATRTPCPYAVPRFPLACSRTVDARPARYVVRARAGAPAPRGTSGVRALVPPAPERAVRWPLFAGVIALLPTEPTHRARSIQGSDTRGVWTRCEYGAVFVSFPFSTWTHEKNSRKRNSRIGSHDAISIARASNSSTRNARDRNQNGARTVPTCLARGLTSPSSRSRSPLESPALSKAMYDRWETTACAALSHLRGPLPLTAAPRFYFLASREVSPRLAQSLSFAIIDRHETRVIFKQPHLREFRSCLVIRVARAIGSRCGICYSAIPWSVLYPLPPLCMETSKKNKDSRVAKIEETETTGPVKVFRLDDVSVSLFARTRNVQGKPVTFYSASFSRSYKDAVGERKFTKSFDADDLGSVVTLAQQASEFIREIRQSDLSEV